MQDNDSSLADDTVQKIEDAKATMTELGGGAKQQVHTAGAGNSGRGATRFSGRVADVAGAADHAAEDLRERGEPRMADWIERGAEGLHVFADGLRKQGVDSLVQRTRGFAQSSPAVLIGSSLIAGVLLGRLLRSVGDAG